MINLTLSYAAILVADFLMRKKQSHLHTYEQAEERLNTCQCLQHRLDLNCACSRDLLY